MGILADVFVSTPQDAEHYEELTADGDDPPSDRFDRVQYKRFTPLEFGTLWAVLEDCDWDPSRHMLEHISESNAETWLEHFPPLLVEKLAGLTDAQLNKTARSWGKTEEIQCDGSELVPVLHDLRRLARSAIEKKRALFLWGSL